MQEREHRPDAVLKCFGLFAGEAGTHVDRMQKYTLAFKANPKRGSRGAGTQSITNDAVGNIPTVLGLKLAAS